MEWYYMISFFCTNGIRIFLCFYFIAILMDFTKVQWKTVLSSLIGTGIVTALSSLSLSQFYLYGAEILFLFYITHLLFGKNPRIYLFLIFFYEIGVALWEFLVSAGLGILFQSQSFTVHTTIEYMAAVWIVRSLMLGVVVVLSKRNYLENQGGLRLASMFAILGLFGVITLSNQSIILLNDDLLTTWMILSLVLMFAIMFYNLNHQYEMEKEILRFKEEQTQLLERDYQTLNQIYTTNAKLYHDLHNHLEVMYRYLEQGKTHDAFEYLKDLRTPIQEISQTIWTGDEAIDYLINSKLSLAEQMQITTKVNIEFPRNTNIRSVDLTAILGNLLDNAIEATYHNKLLPRYINLTIRRINDMLVIKMENSCEVPPVRRKEELQSTKQDQRLHGWGLKSVRTAVEHYDGTIETSFENNQFRAVVILSYKVLPIK